MLDQTIETLSKGFRRRVGLAQAIVHDPPVLILDEPTDGLDPNQKHEVRTLINDMARDKIIVISTHISRRGRRGVHARHHHRARPHRRRRHAAGTGGALALPQRRLDAARAARTAGGSARGHRRAAGSGAVEVSERDARLTALPRAGATILPALSELAARPGIRLKELHLESGRLDEVFRTITA